MILHKKSLLMPISEIVIMFTIKTVSADCVHELNDFDTTENKSSLWTASESLQFQCTNMVEEKINKTILKLAVKEAPPYIFLKVSNTGEIDLFDGPEVQILKAFEKKFNIEFDIRLPPDGEWGSNVNGTWTGLIGMVNRKEVDIAAGCLTMTNSRYKASRMSTPYDIQRSVIVTKTPSYGSKVYAVLLPFSKEVWALIIGAFLVNTVLLFVIGKVYSDVFGHKPLPFGKIFWYFLGSFSAEGGKLINLTGTSAVLVLSMWLLFVLIVQASYCGTLMPVLSLHDREPAIETLADVASAITNRGLTPGCLKGTTNYDTLAELDGPLEIITKKFFSDNTSLVTNVKDGLEKVLSTDYALLAQEIGCRFVAQSFPDPDFHMSNEGLGFEPFAFALADDFQFLDDLNWLIGRAFEAGLIDKWRRDQTSRMDMILWYSSKTSITAVPLRLVEMKGALLLCVYGLFLATLVFLAERIIWRYQKKTTIENDAVIFPENSCKIISSK